MFYMGDMHEFCSFLSTRDRSITSYSVFRQFWVSYDFYAESEIAVWGLNEDLLVIGHDTAGVTDPMVPFVDMLEALINSNGVNSAGVFYAEGASHQ